MKNETWVAMAGAAFFAYLTFRSRKAHRECKTELDFILGRQPPDRRGIR